MKYSKVKAVDIYVFILPMIIISVVFLILSLVVSNQINSYYIDMMQKESNKLAHNTSIMLSKSSAAYETINDFMSKRVLEAAREISKNPGQISNETLSQFAYDLNVDVIYYYNSNGEIIASNTGEYIGWKSFNDHPVERFRLSDLGIFVEDIRLDPESNVHYKYAYSKLSNNDFIQVGIYAEDVFLYLSEFEQQNIIDDLKNDDSIYEINIINKKYKILASSNPSSIGLSLDTSRMVNSLDGKLFLNNEEPVYEVFAPINLNYVNIGYLNIQYSIDSTQEIIQNMTQFGIVLILSFYVIVLSVLFNSYQKNKRLIQLAYFDGLTKLPNIDYLKYYIEENLKKDKTINALILVNCVNFKRINMSYGFKEGDFVIQKIAEHLKKFDAKNCTTFKFNADRFVVLVENVNDRNEIQLIVQELDLLLKANDISPEVEINMGIVEIEPDKQDADRILRDVSIALNSVDRLHTYAFFNDEMNEQIHREDRIEEELKEAIKKRDDEHLYFDYQPIFDLQTRRIIGFEALARMQSRYYGFVSPLEFIDIAERKHIIVPLGEYLLNEACISIKHLEERGYDTIKIAVNISGIQLMQDDFVYTVERMIKKHMIRPEQLELEITESVYMQDFESINQKVIKLKEMGLSISMDDFGTGFSSFYRLKETSLDILKIDRAFIKNIDSYSTKKPISQDIISIAHKYNLKCVAEGIENVFQLESLLNDGCDFGQGYYLAYPMRLKQCFDLLELKNKAND